MTALINLEIKIMNLYFNKIKKNAIFLVSPTHTMMTYSPATKLSYANASECCTVLIDGNVMVQSSSILFDEKISGVEKAKIVGKNIAELCKKVKIDNVVFDKGAYNYNGRVKALADACREFGLKF